MTRTSFSELRQFVKCLAQIVMPSATTGLLTSPRCLSSILTQTKRLKVQTKRLHAGRDMGRPAQDITESELAVLRILWDRERPRSGI